MIAYLSGKVLLSMGNFIILNTGNIGYRLFVKTSLAVSSDADMKFFVHHHIRDNAEELYGFLDYFELKMFEQLISVSGVGPKAAMSILSAAPVDSIANAIANDDVAFFTTLPGIGKKVSAKIILDLRKKVSGIESSGVIAKIDDANEVIESLMALGYKKPEVVKIFTKMPADISGLEDKVRWCLKNLAKA